MSAGTDIADEVHAALIEAAVATGNGEYIGTLRKTSGGPDTPWAAGSATETDSDITILDFNERQRDQSGTLIGETMRTLYVTAKGATPEKGDQIAVGIAMADVLVDTVFHEIGEVRPLSPGGVDLMFECDLKK